jgi:argininosuccinate lyase
MALLTTLKGLPLAYNKDMQEDKESIFDAVDTVKMCLQVFSGMVATMTANCENMKRAAQKGFINATDLADYLVASKGMPFRTAYKITGGIIGYCIEKGKILDDLTVEEYKTFHESFDEGVYEAISLENCIARRISRGSTGYASVDEQILWVEDFLKNN